MDLGSEKSLGPADQERMDDMHTKHINHIIKHPYTIYRGLMDQMLVKRLLM